MRYDKSLVGRKVLVAIGSLDTKGKPRRHPQLSIREITKVMRKGFRIEGSVLWFDYDGFQMHKQQQMAEGATTFCYLLSDEEHEFLTAKFAERRRVAALRKSVEQDIIDVIKSMKSWI